MDHIYLFDKIGRASVHGIGTYIQNVEVCHFCEKLSPKQFSKFYILILCIIFLNSCINKSSKTELENIDTEKIPVLDVSGNLSNQIPDTFTWNSIAENIKIIPLKSSQIGRGIEISHISDNLIIISEAQTRRFFCYDGTGKLISTFSHQGNGPGEYTNFAFACFNEIDSTLLLHDNNKNKILAYTLKGIFAKGIQLKDVTWTNIRMKDKYGYYTRNGGTSSALVSVLDNNFNTKKTYFEFDSTLQDYERSGYYIMSTKSTTKDKYLVNKANDDTVYTITYDSIKPFCVIIKETHALPNNLCETFLKIPPRNDYFTYTSIDAFSSYIIFRYLWQERFKAELWNTQSEKKIATADLVQKSDLEGGFKFVFESGNSINILPAHVTDRRLVFLVKAEKCIDGIPGVREEDDPVLIIINLK